MSRAQLGRDGRRGLLRQRRGRHPMIQRRRRRRRRLEQLHERVGVVAEPFGLVFRFVSPAIGSRRVRAAVHQLFAERIISLSRRDVEGGPSVVVRQCDVEARVQIPRAQSGVADGRRVVHRLGGFMGHEAEFRAARAERGDDGVFAGQHRLEERRAPEAVDDTRVDARLEARVDALRLAVRAGEVQRRAAVVVAQNVSVVGEAQKPRELLGVAGAGDLAKERRELVALGDAVAPDVVFQATRGGRERAERRRRRRRFKVHVELGQRDLWEVRARALRAPHPRQGRGRHLAGHRDDVSAEARDGVRVRALELAAVRLVQIRDAQQRPRADRPRLIEETHEAPDAEDGTFFENRDRDLVLVVVDVVVEGDVDGARGEDVERRVAFQ
mmetsp:Transcript_33824/g.101856  ORF Transcript_33824/g.101856 Transcript_33824/m.101856 type:complete len:384 (-) Transcript_33824:4-1155(-)